MRNGVNQGQKLELWSTIISKWALALKKVSRRACDFTTEKLELEKKVKERISQESEINNSINDMLFGKGFRMRPTVSSVLGM